jgi:VanZ family protein
MTRFPLRRAVYFAVGAAFLYSLFTEWGQSFVPDRSASLYDIGVNGAATLITAWLILRRHDAHNTLNTDTQGT